MRALFVMLSGLLLCACAPAAAPGTGSVLIVRTSPLGVHAAMDRVQQAVTAKGAHVFARVDHAAGAQKAGLGLAPEEVLIFGNPRMGTPLMQANARFGLDLPLKILVWQDSGVTKIAFTDPVALGARYGLPATHKVLVKMRKVLDAVTDAAATPAP